MRLFIAIELEEQFRAILTGVQDAWRRRGVQGSFTPPENLHLTLAFLGEYPDPDAVLEAMERVHFPPVQLRLDGFGSFGDLYWCGLESGGALEQLSGKLRRALAEDDLPFDRKRFRAHITLVRRAIAPKGKLPGTVVPEASMTAHAVTLMRSERGRHGMIYTPLGGIPLDHANLHNPLRS